MDPELGCSHATQHPKPFYANTVVLDLAFYTLFAPDSGIVNDSKACSIHINLD